MRKPTIFALGAAAVLCVTGTAFAAVNLPYADTFDVPFVVADPYTQTGGPGTITASTAVPHPGAGTGTSSLCISNTTLNLAITDGKYSNVWIQVYSKPVTGASDPTVAAVSGAFYVQDDGTVRVWNGTAWADADTGVAAGTWVGFLIHVDHGNNLWDLYANNGTFLADASLIAGEIAIGGSEDDLIEFSVQSGDAGYIDALALGVGGESVTAASPGNVAVAAFGNNLALHEFVIPVYAGAWTSSRELGGALGAALISGLTGIDQVQFASTNNTIWDVYNVGIPTPRAFANVSPAESAASKEIFENTKILLNLYDDRIPTVTYGFFPYDTASYLAEDGASTGPAVGQPISAFLNGKGGGEGQNPGGWTAMEWNDASVIQSLPFNDDELQHGDQLFIAAAGSPNRFTEYWYSEDPDQTTDTNTGTWMLNANSAIGTSVPAAAKIWVKREAAGGVTVTYVR
ncbi:MAG: hypothetical protein ACI9OU_000211 [Candidatus Promineifilaceae bacterium]|jgi:hypothetical protein